MNTMKNKEDQRFRILLQRMHAQASNGLAFSTSQYDIRRFAEILEALGEIEDLLNTSEPPKNRTPIGLRRPASAIGSQEYVTPKVAVATAVFDADREVLLVQRERSLWTLPGGYADVGFDPARNAVKEVREETGLEVDITALVGIYDSSLHSFPTLGRQVYTLVFYAGLLGGSLCADPVETLGASFFSLDSLPCIPNVTRSQIALAYRIHQGLAVTPFLAGIR
jgi:ADP-ribose pyrophosphatase YjhB (NUDIX family)